MGTSFPSTCDQNFKTVSYQAAIKASTESFHICVVQGSGLKKSAGGEGLFMGTQQIHCAFELKPVCFRLLSSVGGGRTHR